MSRSGRLFEIIQILRRAPTAVSAQTIAEALEVSKRTIYRDVVTLQAMRVPIAGEAGVGYVMQAGFDLPPLMFTDDEIEAITVGLSLLGRTGDANLQEAAARVSRKIADVLPDAVGSRGGDVPLYVSHWHEVPAALVEYRLIRQAIREERKLHLHYQDAEGHSTKRTVRPIALVYYVNNVLLAAWCELREDFRHFRVDRMAVCQPADSLFTGESDLLREQWRARHELFAAF